MLADKVEPMPATAMTHRAAFFRQSGWMMVATIVGGGMTWIVHFLSHFTGSEEYGIFGVLLSMITFVPSMPLQMVLAQQTAKALATGRPRELAGIVRLVWLGTTAVWAVACVVIWLNREHILLSWKIANPAGLWITLPALLLALWLPVFSGVLQGRQNFLWLGWASIINGVGRVGIAAFAVMALSARAAGMMTGVLLGTLAGVGICLWQSRSIWALTPVPFDWRTLLRQMLPLMIGFAAFQFLFSADMMFTKRYFDSNTAGYYLCAGTLSRALMWLVLPLATVMFPRIVHSVAKSEKTDVMKLVLLGTLILAASGAVGLSLLGRWVITLMSGPAFVAKASAMLPWYSAAMIPLSLAYILLNNLMARSLFQVVPFLCLLAIAYAVALGCDNFLGMNLTWFHDTPIAILKTLCITNVVLLLICAFFTRLAPKPAAA